MGCTAELLLPRLSIYHLISFGKYSVVNFLTYTGALRSSPSVTFKVALPLHPSLKFFLWNHKGWRCEVSARVVESNYKPDGSFFTTQLTLEVSFLTGASVFSPTFIYCLRCAFRSKQSLRLKQRIVHLFTC